MAIIKFERKDSEPLIVSAFTRPSVLLDNCALQQFAEDDKLGHAFADAVVGSGATVCISAFNAIEMSKASFNKHSAAVDSFLHGLFPHIYFLEFSAALADNSLLSEPRQAPPADQETAAELLNRRTTLRDGPDGQIGVFTQLWLNRERLATPFASITVNVANEFLKYRQDPDWIAGAQVYIPKANSVRTTSVMGELMRELVLDKDSKFPPNHSADLMYATIGLSYCEFVALDRGWAHRARIARQRMAAFASELAMPFAANRDGLAGLVGALRASTPQPP